MAKFITKKKKLPGSSLALLLWHLTRGTADKKMPGSDLWMPGKVQLMNKQMSG